MGSLGGSFFWEPPINTDHCLRRKDFRMMMHRAKRFLLLFLPLLFLFCLSNPSPAQVRLRLATTTSVQDSGLMPYLLEHFEKQCNCKVDVIAVGTGQALKLASNGDVDMVLVHAPPAEKKFVSDGHVLPLRDLPRSAQTRSSRSLQSSIFSYVSPNSFFSTIQTLSGYSTSLSSKLFRMKSPGAPSRSPHEVFT